VARVSLPESHLYAKSHLPNVTIKHLKRPAFLTVLLVGLAVLQGCAGEHPQSAVNPATNFATQVDDLFNLTLWWGIGVFVVVEAILIYTLVRFRDRPGAPRPKHVHGNTVLEIGWTLVPSLILIAIAIPTIRTIFVVDVRPTDPDALVVEVVGRQWWWEFRYPELGIVTANEAHVPRGRTIDMRLRSADVLHSFWIPRLGGKRDMVPGNENGIWFVPDSVGVFWGQCAEYCGTAHALMGMRVIVEEPADFDAWAEANLANRVRMPDAQARSGEGVFLSNACVGCHTVRGTTARGVFGPDLTHFGSRGTIAAGVLENTRENLIRWLDSTQHVKPGNRMPEVQMSDQQIEQLAAYLQALR